MKYVYFIFVILFLGLMSCSEKKIDQPFSIIDYSHYHGWTSVYSIKVDSLGQIYIQGEDINGNKWFIRTEISSTALDSLSTLVNKIDYVKLDTLYKKNCEDCGYYYLIINRRKMPPIKVFVEDTINNDENLIYINELSQYLDTIIETIRQKMKSIQFESKTKGFYLLSPPPARRSVPDLLSNPLTS